MKLYNIKVYFNKLKKKRFNGNLHVPVHSSLLEELVGLLICASYIARSASGLGQLQHPLAFSGSCIWVLHTVPAHILYFKALS